MGLEALIRSDHPASYAAYGIEPKSEIRILVLLPPDPSQPSQICGTLLIAKLEDYPPYEVLSYVWGEPNFTERLYLPEGYLAITLNLASALRTLRYEDQPRRLWVDAICINQHDDKQKGHQVNLMSHVYRHTQCTLAWLGEGTEHSAVAFSMLETLKTSAWMVGITSDVLLFDALKPLDDISKSESTGVLQFIEYFGVRSIFNLAVVQSALDCSRSFTSTSCHIVMGKRNL